LPRWLRIPLARIPAVGRDCEGRESAGRAVLASQTPSAFHSPSPCDQTDPIIEKIMKWYQFRLRSLFILTVVVALGCAVVPPISRYANRWYEDYRLQKLVDETVINCRNGSLRSSSRLRDLLEEIYGPRPDLGTFSSAPKAEQSQGPAPPDERG